jgi:hypothetical protein
MALMKNKGVVIEMGRTKRGNANAQRNKNKKRGSRVSEELVEFSTTTKERKDQPVID